MINKTFRLFISSTFSDFLEERNQLNRHIHKIINEYCQSRGYHFQLIDLRWGVNTETSLMQNTLSVCLEEVRRCKKLSPKPNFLLMIGERYGWIPLPAQIKRGEFEQILSVCSGDDRIFLQEWYVEDNNEIGGIFYLKPRTGSFIDESEWTVVEERLRQIILDGAKSCSLPQKRISELSTSATEEEIMEGLLGNSDVCKNVIAVFRDGFAQKDDDLSPIHNLRQRILDRMNHDDCMDNVITLTYGDGYIDSFTDQIVDLLKSNIDREITRIETAKIAAESKHVLSDMVARCGPCYMRRENLLINIDNYVNGESHSPLFLFGEPGIGKSTLLADYLLQSPISSFFAFYGQTERSYTLIDSINHIFGQLVEQFQLHREFVVNTFNIAEMFYQAVHAVPKTKKVLIVIDGLEMFDDISQIRENLFPTKLPPNVKLIISTADEALLARFMHSTIQLLTVGKFNAADSYTALTQFLSTKNRCLSDAKQIQIVQRIISTGVTPLHIHLMSTWCARWRSDDNISDYPAECMEMASLNITSMFRELGHNRELVLCVLSLIAVAPYGITETELVQLLLQFPQVKTYFISEDRYAHNLEKLPFVVWSRLFFDLQNCLMLTIVRGQIVVKFRHQIFHLALTDKFPSYLKQATDLLIRYYSAQSHYFDNTGAPNLRKVLMLPALLQKNERLVDLQELFADLQFVDAAVKAGEIERLIENLVYIIPKGMDTLHRKTLIEIHACLQQNRGKLSCYQGNFLACAFEAGLWDQQVPTLFREEKFQSRDQFYFPYSSQSNVSWSADGTMYAVCYGSYCYICSKETYSERCRIFLQPISSEEGTNALWVTWIDEGTIALLTSANKLLIYNVSGDLPQFVNGFDHDTNNHCIRYAAAQRILLYISNQCLYAKNPFTGEECYRIEKLKHAAGFDIDIDCDELTLCGKNARINIYTLSTGEYKRTIKKNVSKDFWHQLSRKIDGYSIVKLKDNIYFIYTTNFYAVFDSNVRAITYLKLPVHGFQDQIVLVGKKYCIITMPEYVLRIDFLERYAISYYPIDGVTNISWVIPDQLLSMLSAEGLEIIHVNDFRLFGGNKEYCFCSKTDSYPVIFEFTGYARYSNQIVRPVVKAFSAKNNAVLDYDVLFGLRNPSDRYSDPHNDTATLVACANDAKLAVAYEMRDAVAVVDGTGEQLVFIDRLHLALNDNILRMIFSPDSKLLLIWRNHSVLVVDIDRGKQVLNLDVSLRPVLEVRFAGDSCSLIITLSDGVEYTFNRTGNSFVENNSIPQKLVASADLDAYAGPYNIYPSSQKTRTETMMCQDVFTSNAYPRKWLRYKRIYQCESCWLLFQNGEFYLNGSSKTMFSHPYCDFRGCLQILDQNSTSEAMMYLRGKNDLSSLLYEIGENYLVLVSRLLNTIIIFDKSALCIIGTYQIPGNIIGIGRADDKLVEVYCDAAPYHLSVTINLTERSKH